VKPYLFCVLAVLFLFADSATADETLRFPSTRKGITESLSKTPKNPLGQSKSLGPKSVPDAIVEDNPKVGALIQFDYDSDAVKSESYSLLREFGLSFQEDLPDAVFVIGGHADSDGSDEYNLNLSQKRAEAVKRFLMSEFHLDDNRLITKPFGEKDPIASNKTEEGRALNRRVEFVRVK